MSYYSKVDDGADEFDEPKQPATIKDWKMVILRARKGCWNEIAQKRIIENAQAQIKILEKRLRSERM